MAAHLVRQYLTITARNHDETRVIWLGVYVSPSLTEDSVTINLWLDLTLKFYRISSYIQTEI
jgi:hypothetical protein